MKKMNKKAIQETVLTIIIGVIVFILMLTLTTVINSVLHATQQRESCRISILEAEISKKAVSGAIRPEIDCPMQVITIKSKDLPRDEADQPDFIRQKFAKAMYDTWYVAGRGERTAFQRNLITGANKYCLIYARINMQDLPVKKAEVNDMSNWLSTETPPESSTSYYSFLSYQGRQGFHIIDSSNPLQTSDAQEIDPSQNYYVVYWTSMDNYLPPGLAGLRDLNDLFNIAQTGPVPQVFVVPEKYFGDIGCDVLLN